jgi:MinD superfamily P-loop ATPase
MLRDRNAFSKLKDKKVIINRCVLSDADVKEFAKEAGVNVYYTLPAVNDRELSSDIENLLKKLGMIR